jgi:hypothetical protein
MNNDDAPPRTLGDEIIRLLELQLHQTHMIAARRNLDCPICIREAEQRDKAQQDKPDG